ncbi:hypothetical protein PG991_001505 [Apiospora marii]|uniref:Xylanolytic transcriptional activator regulatory domain-containing protein n=1 Tax=Apiospora marii TaxID=335849 RepID=A0ABR1SPW8_9PEZI
MTWSFSTRDPGSGDNARSHLTTRAILTSEPHIQQTTTGNDDGRSHDSENHQETRQRGSTGTAAGRPRLRRMPPVEGEVRRRDAVPEMQGPAPALRVQHHGRPRPGQRCTGRLAADAGGALPTESLKRASENLPSGLASPEEPGQQPPGQTPRPTPVAAENDDAAPAAESPLDEVCTIDVINDDVAHYSGELSHWNFSMRIKRNIDTLMATSQVPQLDGQQRVPEFIRVPEPLSDTTLMTDLLKVLPPRPVASFLVHVFFTHATSFYFFLDQRWVMSTLDSLYQSPSRHDSKNVVPACAVTMVMAVGAQYAHLESPDRDQTNTNRELEIGSTFYRHVARLLAGMIHSGSIISVQICLLLGLYCLPLDASGLGYIYLNLAMKLAIQNGMHRRPVSAVPDALKEETRCRLWWTVYCLERKIGMFHGRPSAISRSNFDANLPTDSPEFSALSGSAQISTFLDAIQLTKYAETLQRDLTGGASNNSAMQSSGTEERRAFPWSGLVQDCLSAATEAIEIYHTMRTGSMGLTRSSYVEYSSCRAAMLVLLAYSIRDRTKVHGAVLQRGLDAIRDMAYAGDSARSEVQLIETLEAALQHMNAFTSPAQYTPRTPQTVPEEGYEGFNGQPGLHVGPAAQLGEWIK